MKQMVINFEQDGSVQHTLKDSFFDTRFLGGRRAVERMSEILFCDESQKFYIQFDKEGPFHGYIPRNNDGSKMLFDTYEAAVEYEVETINNLRLQGCAVVKAA